MVSGRTADESTTSVSILTCTRGQEISQVMFLTSKEENEGKVWLRKLLRGLDNG
jgi:hypothetical protein